MSTPPSTLWHPAAVGRGTLAVHVLGASMIQASQQAVVFMLPVVAKKHFDATNWQTVLITALPTTLFVLSIFWNSLFERSRLWTYLLVFWLISSAPMLLTPLVNSTWQIIVLHTIACIGGAGYYPAAGRLLKRLYPDAGRGWVYSVLAGSNMLVVAAMTKTLGSWLDHDPDAFRIYMPGAAVLALAGCGMLSLLGNAHGAGAAVDSAGARPFSFKGLLAPIVHMRSVLKADPAFARYEASFMTYGVGWMVCYALLPILVTDKLGLSYDEVGKSTQVAYALAVVVALMPWGRLMDRLGPVKVSGAAFAGLALYPVGLLVSSNPNQLAITSVVYGLAHAGVTVGWMLGPVALAPSAEKVPHYVAIHATLVGLRGALFQFLGVGLYWATGSFTWPLLAAAFSFLWAAQQMWSLDRRLRPPALSAGEPASPEES